MRVKERKFKHLGKEMRERRDSHGNLIGYILDDPEEVPQDSLSDGSLDAEKQLFDFIERWSDETFYSRDGNDKVIKATKDKMEIKLIFKK